MEHPEITSSKSKMFISQLKARITFGYVPKQLNRTSTKKLDTSIKQLNMELLQ